MISIGKRKVVFSEIILADINSDIWIEHSIDNISFKLNIQFEEQQGSPSERQPARMDIINKETHGVLKIVNWRNDLGRCLLEPLHIGSASNKGLYLFAEGKFYDNIAKFFIQIMIEV